MRFVRLFALVSCLVFLVCSMVSASVEPVVIPVVNTYKQVPFTAGGIGQGAYSDEMYNGEPVNVVQFFFQGDPEEDVPPGFTITLSGIYEGNYYIGLRVRSGLFLGDVSMLESYRLYVNRESIELSTATELQRSWISDSKNPNNWGVARAILQSKEKIHLSAGDEIMIQGLQDVTDVHLLILYPDEIERGLIDLPINKSIDYSEFVVYDIFDEYSY